MELFDSHTHFDSDTGKGGYRAVVERAIAAGVTRMTGVGGSPDANARVMRAAMDFPENVFPATGLDRYMAEFMDRDKKAFEDMFACFESRLKDAHGKAVCAAVGETGLDFHYESGSRESQIDLFRRHLDLSVELGLPLIVHSRDAEEETLFELRVHARNSTNENRPGVLHCFTGGKAFAGKLLDLGYFISISGIATFGGADALRETVKYIPDDSLLAETDSPYLAPEPYRGKRNEPAYLHSLVEKLAVVRGTTARKVADITVRNAESLFVKQRALKEMKTNERNLY